MLAKDVLQEDRSPLKMNLYKVLHLVMQDFFILYAGLILFEIPLFFPWLYFSWFTGSFHPIMSKQPL